MAHAFSTMLNQRKKPASPSLISSVLSTGGVIGLPVYVITVRAAPAPLDETLITREHKASATRAVEPAREDFQPVADSFHFGSPMLVITPMRFSAAALWMIRSVLNAWFSKSLNARLAFVSSVGLTWRH